MNPVLIKLTTFIKDVNKKAKAFEDAKEKYAEAEEKIKYALYDGKKADDARKTVASAKKEMEKALEKAKPYQEIFTRFNYLEDESQAKLAKPVVEDIQKKQKKKLFVEKKEE